MTPDQISAIADKGLGYASFVLGVLLVWYVVRRDDKRYESNLAITIEYTKLISSIVPQLSQINQTLMEVSQSLHTMNASNSTAGSEHRQIMGMLRDRRMRVDELDDPTERHL